MNGKTTHQHRPEASHSEQRLEMLEAHTPLSLNTKQLIQN